MSRKIRLAITPGDAAGIGPEVVAAALSHLPPEVECRLLGKPVEPAVLGQPSSETARASWDALEEAAALALAGEVDGVVTGPVCKNHLYQVGFQFPGQTEFFAKRAARDDLAMCLTGGRMTVALVTAHVPLREVAGLLRSAEIIRVGKLLAAFLRLRGLEHPRIAVAGLNPHAGEGGEIGREEIEIIEPAVAELSENTKAHFGGPIAPDTVFFQAAQGNWDAVLCMYHDQGLIPLKLHAFDEGVNVTLGLPFVRTSPDHGTAFALAGRGLASPRSMIAAIRLAAELCEARRKS